MSAPSRPSVFSSPLFYALVVNALAHLWRYLEAVGRNGHGLGFNSDDAWIHLTFARNIARHFEFAHTPGIASTGSTSPLWSLLLSVPHLVSENVDFILWAVIAISVTLWLASALVLGRLVERLSGNRWAGWAAAFLFINEWHMIWAALSGMEIMLFILLALLLMDRALDRDTRAAVLGVLGGLLFLARPEGVLLFALAGVTHLGLQSHAGRRELVASSITMGIVALAVVSPVLIFYLVVDGSLVPNTFHAKSAFYRISDFRAQRLSAFLGEFVNLFARGHMLVLAPWALLAGVVSVVTGVWRRRLHPALLIVGWGAIFLAAYSWKLPMGFQRARYLMPLVPLFLALAMTGLFACVSWLLPGEGRVRVGLRRGVPAAVVALALGYFWVASWSTGVGAHVADVLFINDQHVRIGRYIRNATPPDAVIATHDIGAIAYFGDRPVVDMVGLVTPAMMPYVHKHRELKRILSGRHPLSASIIGPYTGGRRDRVDYLALFTNLGAGFYEDFRFFDEAGTLPSTSRLRDRDRDLRKVIEARFSLDLSPTGSVFTLYTVEQLP